MPSSRIILAFMIALALCCYSATLRAETIEPETEKVDSEISELEGKVEAAEKNVGIAPPPEAKAGAPTPTEGTENIEEAPVSGNLTNGQIMQVVPTKSFVEFSELDPLPSEAIKWDKNSGRFLYISKSEAPFIFLFGNVRPGYELSLNNKWVAVRKGRFEVKLNLPLEPSQFTLKIFGPNRSLQLYRLAYSWTKFPPALRFRVKEEEKVIEKAWGYSGRYSRSGWLQLYSNNNPVPVVDLDSVRLANLSFRIYYPPEPEEIYDGYQIYIFNDRNEEVANFKRLGAPPPFIDWRELAPKVFEAGSYQYRIDLFRGEYVFQGKPNRFDTIESYSLVNHRYRRKLEFEPREEIGYFSWSNKIVGQEYEGLYIGADLPAALWNQFLLRGTVQASLHNLDEGNVLSFMRIGAGIRLFGGGHNGLLGDPYLFRLDVYLNYSNFTVKPYSNINRFSHPTVLIEPHFLLWNYHYVVPWLEFGTRPNRSEERLSFGLGYFFYIRPWSIKLGLQFSYDKLLTFTGNPDLRFTTLRSAASLTYIL